MILVILMASAFVPKVVAPVSSCLTNWCWVKKCGNQGGSIMSDPTHRSDSGSLGYSKAARAKNHTDDPYQTDEGQIARSTSTTPFQRPYCRLQKVGIRPGTIYAGAPSSLGFGFGGQSYSNSLATTGTAQALVKTNGFCRTQSGRPLGFQSLPLTCC